MLELSLQQVLLRAVAYLVIAGVHGMLIAGLARLFGAMGPSYDGRLTPAPFAHLDLLGLLSTVLGQFGWIRPVALQAEELRRGRLALVAVALLALALTLAIALGLWSARGLVFAVVTSPTLTNAIIVGLRIGVEVAVLFTLFNLVPLPPLTGGLILQAAAPRLHAQLERAGPVIRLGLTALIVSSILPDLLRPFTSAALRVLLGS